MFEYMKIKTNYFIRCLQCQYIDKVEHAINVESPWTCDRCGTWAIYMKLKL